MEIKEIVEMKIQVEQKLFYDFQKLTTKNNYIEDLIINFMKEEVKKLPEENKINLFEF